VITLYVLVGAPGSGKSYWANASAAQLNAVVVSSDEVRNDFLGEDRDPHAGESVFAEVERRAREALQANRSVILDATHYQRKYRLYALNLAREFEVPSVAIWFDAPLEECLKRNRWRSGRAFGDQIIPDQIIHDIVAHLEPPTPDEFDRIVRIAG
jgi:predicted kinase